MHPLNTSTLDILPFHAFALCVVISQMSEFNAISPKHCANKGFNLNKLYKKLLYALSTLLIFLTFLILLIYLILHPSKPDFFLREAAIYQLDLSGPNHNLLNSSLQLTLLSTNPNHKVGLYYDSLRLYAAYKGQDITTQATLPPFYQGHQDNNILTAFLNASALPVASSFGYQVSRDQRANGGTLVFSVRLNGGIKWKVGTWVSSRYHLNVDCVVVMSFPQLPGVPLITSNSNNPTHCSTSV